MSELWDVDEFYHTEDEEVFRIMDEYKVKGSNRDRVRDAERNRMIVTNRGLKTVILPLLGKKAREAKSKGE